MRHITLNKRFFLILNVLALSALWACNNNPTQVQNSPPPKTTTPPVKTGEGGLFYGHSFRVQNSSAYEKLLESCRRCGTRRLIQGPGGHTTYQRFWTSHSDPKRCRNWNTEGYIQIHFQENKLPTTAVVSIQPQYTDSNNWGEPFSVTAQARPINKNRGFEIFLNPSEGLGGVHTLTIRSNRSNHVRDSQLNLSVVYGGTDSQTIISQSLSKLTKRAIRKSVFNCNTYTN